MKKDTKERIKINPKIEAAYHEAGHAAVSLFYNHKLKFVRIKRKTGECQRDPAQDSNYFFYRHDHRPIISTFNLELIQVAFAGVIAVNLKGVQLKPNEDGSKADFSDARNDIMAICLDRKIFGEEFFKLYEWLDLRTTEALKIVWPAVEAIAKELLEKNEMSGQRALELYRNAKINKFKNRIHERN